MFESLKSLFTALLLSIIPTKGYLNHGPIHVDLMELNHVHNTQGQYTFSQVIFWNQFDTPEGQEYRVMGYIMIDSHAAPYSWPIETPGGWEASTIKYLGQVNQKVLIKVVSRHFRESWTNHDAEVEGRKRWKYDEVPNIFDVSLKDYGRTTP